LHFWTTIGACSADRPASGGSCAIAWYGFDDSREIRQTGHSEKVIILVTLL
jgi:hypothetical protein